MSSSVPFDNVVLVLESVKNQLGITVLVAGNTLTIFKNGVPECLDFPAGNVSQKMLHRFQAKYKVPIEFFYRPGLINASSNASQ